MATLWRRSWRVSCTYVRKVGVSTRQFQASLWQITGVLSLSSNCAHYQATSLLEDGADAGYGVWNRFHSHLVLLDFNDHYCFWLPVHTEEPLLYMQPRHPCRRDTRKRNCLVGMKIYVNHQHWSSKRQNNEPTCTAMSELPNVLISWHKGSHSRSL